MRRLAVLVVDAATHERVSLAAPICAKNEVFPRFGRRRRWFGRTRRRFRGADTCADGLAEQGSVASVPGTKASANLVLLATDEDLDRLEELLAELRELSQLRERKRGSFSRGSHAFLGSAEGQR
jgi:hypothetical protein